MTPLWLSHWRIAFMEGAISTEPLIFWGGLLNGGIEAPFPAQASAVSTSALRQAVLSIIGKRQEACIMLQRTPNGLGTDR